MSTSWQGPVVSKRAFLTRLAVAGMRAGPAHGAAEVPVGTAPEASGSAVEGGDRAISRRPRAPRGDLSRYVCLDLHPLPVRTDPRDDPRNKSGDMAGDAAEVGRSIRFRPLILAHMGTA